MAVRNELSAFIDRLSPEVRDAVLTEREKVSRAVLLESIRAGKEYPVAEAFHIADAYVLDLIQFHSQWDDTSLADRE